MTLEGFFAASAMPDRDWWAALWPDPGEVLHALGIRPGMTVIDLCCGDGYFTAPLARIVGGKVYAIDIDSQMLEQARVEADRQRVSVAAWIRGDAYDVAKLVPEPVDYVLIANTFHGVPDKTGFARAVAEVLKPGGHFGGELASAPAGADDGARKAAGAEDRNAHVAGGGSGGG